MNKVCSICAAPAEIRRIVNQKLAEQVRMIDIAAATGFSKSSVHRHSQKCLSRVALANFKALRFPATPGRILVQWPDSTQMYTHSYGTPVDVCQENDVLIRVSYERPRAYREAPNPPALLELAHAEALAENAERFRPI